MANVGDSRGVLCDKDGNAVPLSHDHKPYQLKERKRIKKAGEPKTLQSDRVDETTRLLSGKHEMSRLAPKAWHFYPLLPHLCVCKLRLTSKTLMADNATGFEKARYHLQPDSR